MMEENWRKAMEHSMDDQIQRSTHESLSNDSRYREDAIRKHQVQKVHKGNTRIWGMCAVLAGKLIAAQQVHRVKMGGRSICRHKGRVK